VTAASIRNSIGAIPPDPRRADREVDDEPGGDADQVREQVEQAEPGEHPDDGDVERQRRQREEVEAAEPAGGQPSGPERPLLVQDVVVRYRQFHGGDGGGQQMQPQPAVQDQQGDAVDDHPTRPDEGEAAQAAARAGAGLGTPQPSPLVHGDQQRRRPAGRPAPEADAKWRHHKPFGGRTAAGAPTRRPV
jgi:hypothetical protein